MLDFSVFETGGPDDQKKIIQELKEYIIQKYELEISGPNGYVLFPSDKDLISQPEINVPKIEKIIRAQESLRNVVGECREEGLFPDAAVPYLEKLYREFGIDDSVP